MPFQHELNNLKQIKISIDHYIEQLKPKLTNKDFSLENRWELFKELSPYLPLDLYDGSDWSVEELGLNMFDYDDFYVERYQPVMYTDRYEQLLERVRENEGGPEDYEQLDQWRESVLALGKRGIHFD